MKVVAILLMLLGVVVIFFLGFIGLLGFAMAFDAPGSADSASNWVFAILMATLPVIISLVLLVLAFLAFRAGKHTRSALIGSVFGLALIGFLVLSVTSSFMAMRSMKNMKITEMENERLYPTQNYIRSVEGGVDTVIVFPDGIVAYRLFREGTFHYAGPLGDLNGQRDSIIYYDKPDTKLRRDELDQFSDAYGRKLTDIYKIR